MPHLKSAKKRMRQTMKLREHNRGIKKAIKKQLKVVVEAVQDKATTVDQLKKEAIIAIKKLDKAGARRVLHPNTVARRKSQIDRMLNNRAKASSQPEKK